MGKLRACYSPHFSLKALSWAQHSSPLTSHLDAPIEITLLQEKRDGPSDKFESVGTLAYHGVICFVLSRTKVAVRICFATAFLVPHEIKASRTPLLSV